MLSFTNILILQFLFLLTTFDQSTCISLKWQSESVASPTKAPTNTPVTKGTESWGYVTVRPKAHIFYWLYRTTHADGFKNRPLVLWLQGGPGASGTGYGNFEEFGPLDTDLKPREFTWLQSANLLFVDQPVGTGFSYVQDNSTFTKDLDEICTDLLSVMKTFIFYFPEFQNVPFYIFSESYGGKMTAGFSSVLYKAIQSKEISINFQGLAMGDSWISPVDFTNSWGPYLYATSIISQSGLEKITKSALKVEKLVKDELWRNATDAWDELEGVVEAEGNGVNFYNINTWDGEEDAEAAAQLRQRKKAAEASFEGTNLGGLYWRHVGLLQADKLGDLMNGPVRDKLMIIPDAVKWGGQGGDVFENQAGDFMKDVVSTVNELVNNTTLKVVVYNGQLDLICDTLGTESWFYRLDSAPAFKAENRTATLCPDSKNVCYFSKSHKNLYFYWVLNAGHMVPADNGVGALKMLNNIIG